MGGFYGNITNTSKTQFQFDKIYPNKKVMLQNAKTDGVYIGRYVLVEYSQNNLEDYVRVYSYGDNLYQESSHQILLTTQNTDDKQIVYEEVIAADGTISHVFYQLKHENSTLEYEIVLQSDGGNDAYTENYFIDTKIYGQGKGYDSTVWQKVYTESGEDYVNIAELNTVVPKFDVVPDAPTMNPVAPHFDINNTDVYYKLHWQAPWGFRVGEASEELSDGTTKWTETVYNPATGKNETSNEVEKNAAIYFNKAGFNESVPNTVSGSDSITITPVSSGLTIYNDHDNPGTTIAANDIQELRINLPSIGNTISKVWDIVHGDDRKDSTGDAHPSLQGRLNAFSKMKDNTIAVKRSSDGTLVGSYINGNTSKNVADILEEKLSESFESDDAWIKTSINTIGLDNNNDLSGISIHHAFHSVDPTKTTANKNDDNDDGNGINKGKGHTLKLYTPHVDAAGHVVGHNTETVTLPYGFKTFTGDNGTASASNTQDTMSIIGDTWIATKVTDDNKITLIHKTAPEVYPIEESNKEPLFGGTFRIQDYWYDANGHMSAQHYHDVKIPEPSLKTQSDGNIITSLILNPSAGAFTQTKNNISNLYLTDYEKKTSNADIAPADTLGNALSKLQTQIHEEETALKNEAQERINQNSTLTNNLNTEINRASKAENNLQTAINNEKQAREDADKSEAEARIAAIAAEKKERIAAIDAEKKAREDAFEKLLGGEILNEAFDTIKEISDWLGENDSGADKVIDDIAVLKGNDEVEGSVAHSIKVAINKEVSNRNSAIAVETNNREAAINAESSAREAAINSCNNQIAAEIKRASQAETSLSETIATYGDIVIHNADEFALADDLINFVQDTYNNKIAELDAAIIGINQEAKRLTIENENLNTIIKDLMARLEALEQKNQITE